MSLKSMGGGPARAGDLMANNTQHKRSRDHNIATGGTQAATWAQIFTGAGAGVVLLLEKTTRLVSPREGGGWPVIVSGGAEAPWAMAGALNLNLHTPLKSFNTF